MFLSPQFLLPLLAVHLSHRVARILHGPQQRFGVLELQIWRRWSQQRGRVYIVLKQAMKPE